MIWPYSNSSARKAFPSPSPAISSSWPSCVPFASRLHPTQFQLLSHELSVHIILFQALLTLFSKFFSVFLHSTSLLSVFLLYLDFDEYYHLFNLYFQINLLFCRTHRFHCPSIPTRLSLTLATFSEVLIPIRAVKWIRSMPHHNISTLPASRSSFTQYRIYRHDHILFHSPLLQKSWLFFLPSLIDMLKLRESSYKLQIIL